MVDKQSKRAPGESPALSFFGGAKGLVIVAAAIILLAITWILWGSYRPDLLIDPVNRHVHFAYLQCREAGRCPTNRGGWQSMTPNVFAVGEAHDRVINRLRAAGFEQWALEGGEEHYRRIGAAISPLFCSAYYNIKVAFDPSERLATAESTFTGTPNCL